MDCRVRVFASPLIARVPRVCWYIGDVMQCRFTALRLGKVPVTYGHSGLC
jgi:hypothetical protein